MHVYGISQAELAEKLGVGRTYLNKILNCKEAPANAKERVLGALDELIKAKT
jgi:transcriptional regulator with XRE-family HTH domain